MRYGAVCGHFAFKYQRGLEYIPNLQNINCIEGWGYIFTI